MPGNCAGLKYEEFVTTRTNGWDGRRWVDETYKVDFSTNRERKYREMHNIRVYEDGVVEIHSLGEGRPDDRMAMRRKHAYPLYGGEISCDYFTPDGVKVRKESVPNLLIYDHVHMMALLPGGGYRGGTVIRYYGEHARPLGGQPINVEATDRDKVRALRKKLKDVLASGHTYYELTKDTVYFRSQGYSLAHARVVALAEDRLGTNHHLDLQCTPEELDMFGWWSATSEGKKELSNILVGLCSITHEVPFLYFKEKS